MNYKIHYKKIKSKLWSMKKALAASLAVVTAVSALPACALVPVQAAKPYVSLRTTFKTLQVGQVNRMTLKNNTLGWKITKVATKDRTIAMVYGKTEASFQIKGKKIGRTTVLAKLNTTARKKFTTKTVRCRVNVIAQQDTQNPTEAVVSNQAELEAALQSKNLKKLEILTDQPGKLTIPKGTYTDVELSVQAPAADVENNGQFKSIIIRAIKPDTWIENAIGNIMQVVADAARIVVSPGARMERLNFARADAKVSLEVNGSIGEVSISAKMELSISGNPQEPINTVIEESAEGTVLETSAPLQVTAHASADITFNEGAENSTVTVSSKDAKVEVKNNTYATITVTKADGTVESKRSGKVTLAGPSSSSGSSYNPPAANIPSTPGAVITTGDALEPIIPDDSDWPYDNTPIRPELGRSPQAEDYIKLMNPQAMITITRAAVAIEGNTEKSGSAISMSAIMMLELKPDQVPLEHDGTIMWYSSFFENYKDWTNMADAAEKNFKFELEAIDDSDILENDLKGISAKMRFLYKDGDFSEDHYGITAIFTAYNKSVIDRYVAYMEKENLDVLHLQMPLEKILEQGVEYVISYDYNEIYITES